MLNKNMTDNDKKLLDVKKQIIKCHKCPLYKTRHLPVIGQGNHEADIMFVGEAPGKNEDLQGRPFCGRAGNIFKELLQSVKLKREDVYICNILKCRPPGNRNPKPEEIEACTPYLDKQIKIIKPQVIGCLGNFATRYLLEKYGLEDCIEGISKIHGKIFKTDKLRLVPLYHPAVATYNPNLKEVLLKDFQIMKRIVDKNK
jgi:uracil-DNA glycosylase